MADLDPIWILIGLAGFLFAGIQIRRRLQAPAFTLGLSRLIEITCALSIVLVASELLGLFGLFRPVPLALAGLASGAVLLRGSGAPGNPDTRRAALKGAGVLVGGFAVLTVVVAYSDEIARSLHGGIYRQDSMWYHLPLAAGFVQDAQIGGLQLTDPMALTSWFYPQNSEAFHAIGMLALGDDFASVFLNLGWAGLALLASWCIGIPYRKSEWTLLTMACILVTPTMVLQAGNAPNDITGLAFMATGIAFAANSGLAGGRPEPDPALVVLSGLAAGLAIGTKMTLVAPLAVILLAIVVLSPPIFRWRNALLWLGGSTATCGFWFIRNATITGNPVPWLKLGPLNGPNQPELYPRPPNAIVDYVLHPDLWVDAFGPGFSDSLGNLWPVLTLAVLTGLIVALLDRGRPFVRFLALAGLLTGVVYIFIPISASGNLGSPTGFGSNLRYAAPGLFLGLSGLVLSQDRLAPLRKYPIVPGILFLITAGGAISALDTSLRTVAVGAAVLLFVGLAATVARRLDGASRLAAGAGLALLLVAVAIPVRSSYLDDRYLAELIPPPTNPGFRATENWKPIQTWGREQQNRRIGIVGPSSVFGQYAFYGQDLSNRVSYAGARIEKGGMRPATSCEEWRTLVNEEGFDLIVSTPSSGPFGTNDSREAWWTRNDPGAREILRSTPASVFRITGELNPSLCYERDRVTMSDGPWGGSSPVAQDSIPPPKGPGLPAGSG